MAEVPAAEVPQAEKDELFCVYASMILKDSDMDIDADKISTLIKASGGSVDSFFTTLFAKCAKGKDIDNFLKFGGGGDAPAAAKKEEKKIKDGDCLHILPVHSWTN